MPGLANPAAEVICPSCGSSSLASRGLVLAVAPAEWPPAPPMLEPRRFAQALEHRLQCRECLHEFATVEQF